MKIDKETRDMITEHVKMAFEMYQDTDEPKGLVFTTVGDGVKVCIEINHDIEIDITVERLK